METSEKEAWQIFIYYIGDVPYFWICLKEETKSRYIPSKYTVITHEGEIKFSFDLGKLWKPIL